MHIADLMIGIAWTLHLSCFHCVPSRNSSACDVHARAIEVNLVLSTLYGNTLFVHVRAGQRNGSEGYVRLVIVLYFYSRLRPTNRSSAIFRPYL